MNKLKAFLIRDWRLAQTRRWSLALELGRTGVLLVSFFFIGRLFHTASASSALAPYGGDYFRFVFLGIAFSPLMASAFGSFTETLAFERGHGTLEAILLTPTSFTTLAYWKALWDLGVTSAKVAFYLLAGRILFHADFQSANWPAVLVISGLTISTFFGLGLFSAGFNLLTRDANPVDLLFAGFSRFLAGVYFPISVFPGWLATLAKWTPLTYALEAVRQSMIHGVPLGSLRQELGVLVCCSLVLIPAGFLFFQWAFQKARLRGTLGFE